MKLTELNEIVTDYERNYAYGSETPLLSQYNERMRELTGDAGVLAQESDADVPEDEAKWWIAAYEGYESMGDDMQAYFDSIAID